MYWHDLIEIGLKRLIDTMDRWLMLISCWIELYTWHVDMVVHLFGWPIHMV